MAKKAVAAKPRKRTPKASSTSKPGSWFVEWIRGGESESGYAVTPASALTYAYVWQATLIVSGDVAGLPLNVYARKADESREVDKDHPVHWLLNEDASPWMSGRTLRECLTSHALLWGNGYAAITRLDGVPVRLSLLLPDRTQPKTRGLEVYYETRLENGQTRSFAAEDILHVKGLGFDGLCGYSVVTLARNSLGLGLSLQRHGNSHFKNGAYPGVVLTTPRTLDKPQADMLLAGWEGRHGGGDNSKRTGILHGGLDLKTIAVNNDDAQWLDSRQFQRVEVASWFNLPPHKLGDSSKVSYNSIESEERSYVTTTLKHWIDRWEDECNRKLLSPSERHGRTAFVEHNLQERLRPDTLQRYQSYESAIRNRWLSPNEVRRYENIPPRDGGDTFENPNTSSARGAATDDTRDPRDSHKRLIASALAKLVSLEVERVRRIAKKWNEFDDLIATFYNEQYMATWTREMQPLLDATATVCSLTTTDAEAIYVEHAKWSMARMLAIAANAFPETVCGEVAAETAKWADRVDVIVSHLFRNDIPEHQGG